MPHPFGDSSKRPNEMKKKKEKKSDHGFNDRLEPNFHRDIDEKPDDNSSGSRWASTANCFGSNASIMAHSKRRREMITKQLRILERQVARLSTLAVKHNENAQVITLPVGLGDLRKRFTPRHIPLSTDISNSITDFQRVKIDEDRPLFIYGKDGGLIAYRTTLKNRKLLVTLTQSIRELPCPVNRKFRGIDRGTRRTRYYCVWSPYAKTPFVSKELQEDGDAGLDFLRKNVDLWNHLSDVLAGIAPSAYKTFLRYPLPNKLQRFCTAWAGCAANIGTLDPVQTEAHRDVKESKFGYSCIVTAGDFTGGALICYELKLIIELPPGSCFFFPDSLITHSNENVLGERSSVVAFTQENMFHYWKRKYGYFNNKIQKN